MFFKVVSYHNVEDKGISLFIIKDSRYKTKPYACVWSRLCSIEDIEAEVLSMKRDYRLTRNPNGSDTTNPIVFTSKVKAIKRYNAMIETVNNPNINFN